MRTLKTLRVTAVSEGDGIIPEQGGKQGIGRNRQDPTGNARFTRLGGSQSHVLGAPWVSSGTPVKQGWGSTAVDP